MCIMMVQMAGTASAQRLSLIKKHPTAGKEWDVRFGLTGENKPGGFEYRLREEVNVMNQVRSSVTEPLKVIVSERTNFGSYGLFRTAIDDENYQFVLALYNKEDKPVKEYDLGQVTDAYTLEVQDIRYENGRFYFNMACPTYSDKEGGRCSKLYCLDMKSGKLVWQSDYLISNDIFVLYGDYIFCSYGFTDERDYLYMLDKKNGEVVSRMSLDNKACYIEVKDGKVYVIDVEQNVYVFAIED